MLLAWRSRIKKQTQALSGFYVLLGAGYSLSAAGAGCISHADAQAEQLAIRQRMLVWQHKRFTVAQLERRQTQRTHNE